MKYKLHVPVEQFGFVEAELESETLDEAKLVYDAIKREWDGAEGLSEKEMNAFVDGMLVGEPNHIEQWERMSPIQKFCAQIIKRSLKRLESREK